MIFVFASLCAVSLAILVTGMVRYNRLAGGAASISELKEVASSSTVVGKDYSNLHLESGGEQIIQRSEGKSFSAEMDAAVMWEGVKQGDRKAISFFMIVIGGTGIVLFFLLTIISILF